MSAPPQESGNESQQPFVLLCRDGPLAKPLRQEHLNAHLEFVAEHIERYLVAGPLKPSRLDGHQEDICGSLFVVYAENEPELLEFMSADPYYACGMYERVEIFNFHAAAGRAVGGCTWLSEKDPAQHTHPSP